MVGSVALIETVIGFRFGDDVRREELAVFLEIFVTESRSDLIN